MHLSHDALMRSIRIVLAFSILACSTAIVMAVELKPKVTAPQVNEPTRILFVGNSYLYYNNSLHNHLRQFVLHADRRMTLQLAFKSATISGARLAHHNIEWLVTPGNLGIKRPFQVVVLQGGSAAALTAVRRHSFEDTVKKFAQTIRSHDGHVALYMPPAYVAPHRRQSSSNAILTEQLYVKVGNQINALVLPVGLAFEASYTKRPNLSLHAPDGSHPSVYGTYLAAATCYAALYGKSPVGNTYDAGGLVAPDIAHHLQEIAWQTVNKFYNRQTKAIDK